MLALVIQARCPPYDSKYMLHPALRHARTTNRITNRVCLRPET
jgi:hypothetical protein